MGDQATTLQRGREREIRHVDAAAIGAHVRCELFIRAECHAIGEQATTLHLGRERGNPSR